MTIEMAPATEQAVRESIAVARSHGEKFFQQIVWQVENEAWTILGYESWDAMREGEYADMGVVAPRADRPELVRRLRTKGLTQQQIGDTIGISKPTVHRILSDVSDETSGELPESITTSTGVERPATYKTTERTSQSVTTEVQADPETGEVIEPEPAGGDGKEHKRPEPKPRVLEGDALADYDARQSAKSVSDALQTLDLMTTAAHRQRVTQIWWPRAARNGEVPPWGQDLFRPEPIRQIAQALHSLANELEGNQS